MKFYVFYTLYETYSCLWTTQLDLNKLFTIKNIRFTLSYLFHIFPRKQQNDVALKYQ